MQPRKGRPMPDASSSHVAVIGGGIVGTATAEALIRIGHRVTLIEPGPFGGTQAASFGNGTFLSPASVLPVSMPGLWKQVPGLLFDRSGPLTIRWPQFPRLAPWLARFVASGVTEAKVARTAKALGCLLAGGPGLHEDLARRIGAPELIRGGGLAYLYHDRGAFEAEALGWRLRRENGVAFEELSRERLEDLVPGLSPRYGFGILLPAGRHCADPGAYVSAIAAGCRSQGMVHMSARATGFAARDGRISAVLTDSGEIACDHAVIAAGIGSKALARSAGDRIPLEAERGYHVELTGAAPEMAIPVMPQDLKVAVVRTRTGLRVAGQVEFALAGAEPDWRRAEILRRAALSCFPELGGTPAAEKITRWQGNRPSTPDGLPVIGRASGLRGVVHAFGHGHIGLHSAPMTARLVAGIITGEPPAIDPAPFRPDRF